MFSRDRLFSLRPFLRINPRKPAGVGVEIDQCLLADDAEPREDGGEAFVAIQFNAARPRQRVGRNQPARQQALRQPVCGIGCLHCIASQC